MARPDSQLMDSINVHLRRTYPAMCRHWFDDIEIIELANGTLRLLVREPVQLRYLQKRCISQFREAAQAVTGHLLAVQFVGEIDGVATDLDSFDASSDGQNSSSLTKHDIMDDMLISPDFSFESFVPGPNNRLARAAAIAVSDQPGQAYNPFFIHGGVGLGKTHLLHAICQTALRSNPSMQIYYTSCNGFMTQFFEAVQAGHMADFRHRYRHLDLLIIDDIHDLAQRDQTQEEFFHTFNSLYQAGKQIVLSSDAAPSEIPHLEDRLVSRFNCGLVARVDKPDYETRVEILKSKAKLRNLELPDDIASYIAAKIDSNIREIEGALTRLQGLSMINDTVLDLALAKQAIGQDVHVGTTAHPTIQDIIDAVTTYYDVKLTDLLSKRRHKSIALPRQVCMWLARKHTRYSLEEIGGYFGGRDHTTVMHAIKAVDCRCNEDPAIEHDVARLEQQLATEAT